VLVGATWVAVRAAETGRATLLILSMALLGVGFNVKMGVALALAPILLGVYALSGDKHSIVRNLLHAAVACVALAVVSLSWTMFYEFTPASDRPYVGSTTGNSMLELALLHNGAKRFVARVRPDPPTLLAGQDATTDAAAPAGARRQRARIFDDSPIGPLRLFRAEEAAQAGWWLPLALAGGLLGWWWSTASPAGRSTRIMILTWSGWTAIYWLVFSFAGGVVHFYYLAVLGPPLAALAGIGLSVLWHRWRTAAQGWAVLPLLLAATALWQGYLGIGQAGADPHSWVAWLCVGSAATALLVGLLLLTKPAHGRARGLWNAMCIACCAALLAMPTACALSIVLVRPNVSAPIANLAALRQNADEARRRWTGNSAATEKLLTYLQGQRVNERFLAAVPSSTVAAPLIIATGIPVIAMGGFSGSDPILTPPDLQRLVETGQLRFVMIGDTRRWTLRYASQQAIDDWVRTHGKPVDPALWRAEAEPAREASSVYSTARRDPPELYDLRG
jgi:4-amino-4-deoxy-L-arabinose transferase-like glycosyltransferase